MHQRGLDAKHLDAYSIEISLGARSMSLMREIVVGGNKLYTHKDSQSRKVGYSLAGL